MIDHAPIPLVEDVVVLVQTVEGEVITSPLMPGLVASDDELTIKMLRDDALNSDRRSRPSWLADDFDYTSVATVRTQYRAR